RGRIRCDVSGATRHDETHLTFAGVTCRSDGPLNFIAKPLRRPSQFEVNSLRGMLEASEMARKKKHFAIVRAKGFVDVVAEETTVIENGDVGVVGGCDRAVNVYKRLHRQSVSSGRSARVPTLNVAYRFWNCAAENPSAAAVRS